MSLHTQQGPELRQWITFLCIVCVHGGILWLAMNAVSKRQAEPIRFLTLIKIAAQAKPALEENAPLPPLKAPKKVQATSVKIAAQPPTASLNTISNKAPEAEAPSEEKSILNLEDLRQLARRNERVRPRSDLEKLQAGQKLDLSIETNMDRELNKIILPECRMALLGKPIIERMQIIQNHTQKKFCRAEM